MRIELGVPASAKPLGRETASRPLRRHHVDDKRWRNVEMRRSGAAADEAEVLADIRRRDERDSARGVAPLKAAADAVMLDTSDLDIEAAFRAAVAIVEAERRRKGQG